MTTTREPSTSVKQTYAHRDLTVALVRDALGYWHWVAVTPTQAYRSRPAARAFWFGHMTRRGALVAACKTLRIAGCPDAKPRAFRLTPTPR